MLLTKHTRNNFPQFNISPFNSNKVQLNKTQLQLD